MSETIINGIDVSECKHLKNDNIKKPLCRSGGCTGVYRSCLCEGNPDCYFKQLKRLQKENEELKARFNELYNNSEQLANKYNKYGGNKENELVEIINKTADKRNKYKQALEEIREIAEDAKKDICDNCGWRNTDSCEPSEYICGEFIKILTKINEVLNDRD